MESMEEHNAMIDREILEIQKEALKKLEKRIHQVLSELKDDCVKYDELKRHAYKSKDMNEYDRMRAKEIENRLFIYWYKSFYEEILRVMLVGNAIDQEEYGKKLKWGLDI